MGWTRTHSQQTPAHSSAQASELKGSFEGWSLWSWLNKHLLMGVMVTGALNSSRNKDVHPGRCTFNLCWHFPGILQVLMCKSHLSGGISSSRSQQTQMLVCSSLQSCSTRPCKDSWESHKGTTWASTGCGTVLWGYSKIHKYHHNLALVDA